MAKKRRNKAVVEGDDSVLNMTPMIDMTFLLVVFFMLSIDLSQKEFIPVELPFALKGIEDTDDTREDVPRYVINLEENGDVTIKGQQYSLSSNDKMEQEKALRVIRAQLQEMTRDLKWREEDGASMIPVMIHGDRMAKWQYVQWIMQVCAHPTIKIYKLQFAVKKPVKKEE